MKQNNIDSIIHAIKSKAIALKNATEIYKECDESEKKELIELMKSTSEELLDLIKDLK